MSVEKFIAELERHKLLSNRQTAKLRESAADPERPLSAKALAKFLVKKNHLSQQQANDVLSGLAARGVDVDITAPTEIGRGTRTTGFVPDDDAAAVGEDEAAPGDGNDPAGSSIFAPYLTGRPSKKAESTPTPPAEADELKIVSDGAVAADAIAPEPIDAIEVAVAPTRVTTRLGRSGKKSETKKASKPKKRAKQWDSPLILLGGGGLTLLVLGGATIWWLLNWQSADQKLKSAETASKSGAYGQAIELYKSFLESAPRNQKRSSARVQLAMATIRQATEAGKFAEALQLAQSELDAIQEEEAFNEAHGELAALLPQIALGLAQQAERADPESEESTNLAKLANDALALCNNAAYVPKNTFRDEGKLAVIRETLQRAERHQQTHQALSEAMTAMEQALADSTTADAYLRYKELLDEFPEVASEAPLGELLKKVIAAEQASIKFVGDEQAAETGERPTPWVAALAVAQRSAAAAGGPAGWVCVRIDGAVFGLDTATGRLLWRRQVGFGPSFEPTRVGDDVLVADAAHQELLRLNGASGEVMWRQAIGESFTQPLVAGDRGFVAAESGRLFVVELHSGKRLGYIQFAQPLRVMPVVNVHHQKLYLSGDHSSLYSIALPDLTCSGVFFLGHSAGSIRVAPALVLDKLAVMENDGVETSRLHLLALDDKGTVAKELADQRLSGSATSPPLVRGSRLLVLTDRGQIDVYDIGSSEGAEALTLIASRAASSTQPVARHAALVNNSIWVGDTQLTKYSILPTGNQLPVESIENSFTGSTFDHSLVAVGNALIHVRRPKNGTGAVVSATDSNQAKLLWETRLAIPPAGAPIVDPTSKSLVAANTAGFVFRFDDAAIRSRVQDQPLAAASRPTDLRPLNFSVALPNGRAAFGAVDFDQLLLYDPAQGDRAARWIKLESPVACVPTAFGGGMIVPLRVGQVFLLGAADGSKMGTPFQPKLQPRTTTNFRSAGAIDKSGSRFVIADGAEKIYHVAVVNQPTRHLEAVADASAGPYPIQSGILGVGGKAAAAAGDSHLVWFGLPKLEPAGDTSLGAPVVWGPFNVGDQVLLATADGQLQLVAASGEVTWKTAIEHGDLAGETLPVANGFLIAYRNGVIERRNLTDGKVLGSVDVAHSLSAGPVEFLQRIVVAANDGTLLVVNQP